MSPFPVTVIDYRASTCPPGRGPLQGGRWPMLSYRAAPLGLASISVVPYCDCPSQCTDVGIRPFSHIDLLSKARSTSLSLEHSSCFQTPRRYHLCFIPWEQL